MSYLIQRCWLENTSSGHDKFYQLFLIQGAAGTGTASTVVAHYGPNKKSQGRFSRPVMGGQIKYYDGQRGTFWHDTKAAKLKKGYVQDGADQDNTFYSKDSFIDHLVQQFGAVHAGVILQNFGLTVDGDKVHGFEPSIEPDTSISEPDERPEAWGSW